MHALLLRNARLIDGSSAPARAATVAELITVARPLGRRAIQGDGWDVLDSCAVSRCLPSA